MMKQEGTWSSDYVLNFYMGGDYSMSAKLSEIFETQERKFKNCIIRDYRNFKANYKNQSGFSFFRNRIKRV